MLRGSQAVRVGDLHAAIESRQSDECKKAVRYALSVQHIDNLASQVVAMESASLQACTDQMLTLAVSQDCMQLEM